MLNLFFSRLKDLKETQEELKTEDINNKKSFEKKLEEKNAELEKSEKEKESFAEKIQDLEAQVDKIKSQLQKKEDEVKNLNSKIESISLADCKKSEQTSEVLENQSKMADLQNTLEKQTQQISQMKNSLQAHTKLAAGLKIEKDNAIKYSNKLKDILEEVSTEKLKT